MNIQRNSMETSMAPSDAGPEALLMDDAMFDLADVLRIIRFRLGIIAGTAVTIIALTAITLFQMTPLYSATALVILEGRQNNVVDIEAVLSGISTDPSSVENQIQILTSRGLAGRVVDTLNLQNDPEFNPRLD
ncbi:MAG: Wzz/FepE/Etk N-terminal domain-containing protein, partial [Alphaproteobacteria bacterium]